MKHITETRLWSPKLKKVMEDIIFVLIVLSLIGEMVIERVAPQYLLLFLVVVLDLFWLLCIWFIVFYRYCYVHQVEWYAEMYNNKKLYCRMNACIIIAGILLPMTLLSDYFRVMF